MPINRAVAIRGLFMGQLTKRRWILSFAGKFLMGVAYAAVVIGPVALPAVKTSQTSTGISQTTVGAPLESFEVASIKPNRSGDAVCNFQVFSIATVKITNCALKYLIDSAYRLKDHQLKGGPGWINSDRFRYRGEKQHAYPNDGKTFRRAAVEHNSIDASVSTLGALSVEVTA
ncbi:MAG: TIGR03435 family protein [Acidobacteriota bacterium]|nr:TIGR03435 family protein [Acidobacteriota bacterium]